MNAIDEDPWISIGGDLCRKVRRDIRISGPGRSGRSPRHSPVGSEFHGAPHCQPLVLALFSAG